MLVLPACVEECLYSTCTAIDCAFLLLRDSTYHFNSVQLSGLVCGS